MNRSIFWLLLSFSALCGLWSCGKGGDAENQGQAYKVKGTVMLDSTWLTHGKLVLFTDNHRTLREDTIELTPEGTFEYEGHTLGLDELYLCGEQGEVCRFYASGNMEVNLSVTSSEEQGVSVKFVETPLDSVNAWLQEHGNFESTSPRAIKERVESLISANPNDIRVSLLLRNQLPALNDSLYVRQTLGSLKEEAKPDWLKKSFDATLSAMGSGKNITYNRRLLNAAFEAKDTLIDLAASRSDYMLVCFWSDYSKPSIDTLRTLANLISKEYEGKRLSFLSCCLHAEDSAMWRVRTNFLDGQHTWVKGGFSDMRMRAWNIQQVPSVILMDMYCNQMQKDVWGGELRRALDRVPNRIGYQKK